MLQSGCRWRDAPPGYGPYKTLYNRFVRWARKGVWEAVFAQLSAAGGPPVALDHSRSPADMNLPGFQLHPLKGTLRGYYAVSVSGNWRVTFRFEAGHAVDINYTDYH